MPNPPPRKPSPGKRPPIKLPDDPSARYRVRDRADVAGNAKVWTPPEGVSLTEAKQLVQSLAAHKKSSTARYEPLPPESPPEPAETTAESEPLATAAAPEIDFGSMDRAAIVTKCGDNPELWAHAFCQITLQQISGLAVEASEGRVSEESLETGTVDLVAIFFADLIEAAVAARQRAAITEVPVGPDAQLEAGRQAALAAARPVAQAAQARHEAKQKAKVVQPPHKPPPSPLSDKLVEGMVDNEPPEEEQLEDQEIHDLLGGVGAAPGATDAKRAAADAERTTQETAAKAEAAYRGATSKLPGIAIPWSAMGKLARSQWTYFVTYGGEQPRTTTTDAHRAALTKAEEAYRTATAKMVPPAVTWESMDTDAREEWIFFVTHGGTVKPAIVTAGGAA